MERDLRRWLPTLPGLVSSWSNTTLLLRSSCLTILVVVFQGIMNGIQLFRGQMVTHLAWDMWPLLRGVL